MPRIIHLARASRARSIGRVGLRGEKAKIPGAGGRLVSLNKAVFAMPQLRDFSISHQWLRELRRWHDERMIAVHCRLPSDEPVWVGRYDAPHALLPLGEAIKQLATSPLGQELIVPRSVTRGEIAGIRDVTQIVGWTETPEDGQRLDCLCVACLPAGSRDLMRRVRGAVSRHVTEARSGGTATDVANALSRLDTALERANRRIPAKKLLPFTNAPDPQVRKVATALLSHFRWTEVEDALARRVIDDHLDVRHHAVEAMVRSGGLRRTYARLHGASDEVLLRFLDELEFPRSVNEALSVLDAMTANRSVVVQRRIAAVRASLRKETLPVES